MKKIYTKKGIASFYMVAMATMLLGILAVGFTTVVVNEINRTTDFDLSKSAYDSALAGIEDAKLAIMNYRSCLTNKANIGDTSKITPDGTVTCDEVIYFMEHPDCYMVGHILGRIPESEPAGEVVIKETATSDSSGKNNMQQAYTCVKIAYPSDYRTRLNSTNSTRVIPIKLLNEDVAKVKSIRISWADNSGVNYKITNFGSGVVNFPSLSSQSASNPPTLSVQLVQTSNEFNLSDFDFSQGDLTDRGTIYMVPYDGETGNSRGTVTKSYVDVTQGSIVNGYSTIEAQEGFVKSNDKTSRNLPFLVGCPKDSDKDFLCSASLNLPEPIGGDRSAETFMLVVSLPYGGPDTDIAISVCTTTQCSAVSTDENIDTGDQSASIKISNQVSIDSTGRANNLYRRVESRVETTSNQFYSTAYDAIQALGSKNSVTIKKDVVTNVENDLTDVPQIYQGLTRYQLSYVNNDPLCTAPVNMPIQQTIYRKNEAKFVISSTIPTCGPHLTFAGWSQFSDGTGTIYQSENVIKTQNVNTNLYAKWLPKQYAIKYHNYNDASFTYHIDRINYGGSATVRSRTQLDLAGTINPPFHDEHYAIVGWTNIYGGKDVVYPIGGTITPSSDMDLYAIWGKTVTYNFYQVNNVNNPVNATYINDQRTVQIQIPAIDRTSQFTANGAQVRKDNLVARGWSTQNSSYINATFKPGDLATITDGATTAYYATIYYESQVNYFIENQPYEPDDRAQKFMDINIISFGASGGVKVDATKIRLANPDKNEIANYIIGHDLDYWRVAVNNSTADTKKGNDEYTNTNDVNMYAVLKHATYILDYYSFDGFTYYGSQNITYGESNPVRGASSSEFSTKPLNNRPNNDSTRNFYGWSLDVKEDTTPDFGYDSSHNTITTQIYTDHRKMYAVWKKDIAVAFNHGTGTINKTETLYNNQASKNITAPAIPGTTDGFGAYTWSKSTDGVTDGWDVNATRAMSTSESRYAAYKKTVNVTYNKNGADGTQTMAQNGGDAYKIEYKPSDGTKKSNVIDAQVKLQDNKYTYTGHSFNKWALDCNTSKLKVEGETIPINTDVTVCADWSAQVYKVRLDNNGATTAGTEYIYEKYGQGYTLGSDGSRQMSRTENGITLPTKKYNVYIRYQYSTNLNKNDSAYATFYGYDSNTKRVIDSAGHLNDNVPNTATTANYPDAGSLTFTAAWGAGSYVLPAVETKDGYICSWHSGSAAGETVSGTQYISADTTFVSSCRRSVFTLTLSPSTDGYISKSSTPGGAHFTDTISVESGTEVKINGNMLYLGNAPDVKYYAHANLPDRFAFNVWGNISNGETITSDKTVTASWSRTKYAVTFVAETGGHIEYPIGTQKTSPFEFLVTPRHTIRVSNDAIAFSDDYTKTIFAKPNSGSYQFKSWSVSDGDVVGRDMTITATFEESSYSCPQGSRMVEDPEYGASSGNKICVKNKPAVGDNCYDWDSWKSTTCPSATYTQHWFANETTGFRSYPTNYEDDGDLTQIHCSGTGPTPGQCSFFEGQCIYSATVTITCTSCQKRECSRDGGWLHANTRYGSCSSGWNNYIHDWECYQPATRQQ